MATGTQIEQRLRAVEDALAALKEKVEKLTPESNWIEAITGSMEDVPEFDEVLRLGRLMRQADRPDDTP